MAYISLRAVHKTYPNGYCALKNFNLDIEAGQFIAVLGPSGAGKSTLLRAMNALDPATQGEISIDGVALNKKNYRKIRAHVGMVFQQFNLVNRLNVMTNVLVGRLAEHSWLSSLFYLFPKTDYQIAEAALREVDLLDKAWSRADKLSGGQQQRVGIARALAQQPKLILADEPIASLDPKASEEVLKLLRKICSEKGITVIINLHQVEYAKQYADRIIALNAGTLVFDGSPEQLTQARQAEIYGTVAEEIYHEPELVLAHA
ncbi:MAG: phosphonate ABC transporter ATP-binding protein [Gammaproteobacteria bacterium HGW-Gammaproteobacteria-3]|jgi:phosphonate transport system ATP-binding protein|nr:MAG: phosphonate ABC transporter ATP-binding protein [Gammaproteobacteria bacterium HGW-Gammaproteobacteria-3]